MASEYLITKWRLWFKLIDVKHAGQLSREDEEQEEEAFFRINRVDGADKQELLETSHKLWDQFIFHGKAGPVTEDEFIEMTNDEFKTDKNQFEEKVRQGIVSEFKLLDRSGEGSLSEECFLKAFKAFGIENETWIKMFFQAFNPLAGKIPQDVYVKTFVQFLISEDSTKQDIFKAALECYPGDKA